MSTSVSHLRAISFSILGFAMWVFGDTCMKLTGEAALPPYEVVAFMGLFGILILAGRAWPRGEVRALWPKNRKITFVIASLSGATNFMNVIALKHMPLTMFYVTVFTAPMIVALLAALFLREHLTVPKIMAILGGFLGVVIAVNPFGLAAGGEWVGYVAALAGTGCFAIRAIILRVTTQSETTESVAFFTSIVNLAFGAILTAFLPSVPVTTTLLVFLFGTGAFSVLGLLFYCKASQYTTAANVSQFHYTQLITGAAIGFIIWHEIPTAHLLMGAILIVASGLYIAHQARKTSVSVNTPAT